MFPSTICTGSLGFKPSTSASPSGRDWRARSGSRGLAWIGMVTSAVSQALFRTTIWVSSRAARGIVIAEEGDQTVSVAVSRVVVQDAPRLVVRQLGPRQAAEPMIAGEDIHDAVVERKVEHRVEAVVGLVGRHLRHVPIPDF